MRISDWSSDVCSSDLSGFCLTDRATWQGGQDSAEQYQSPWPHFPLPSRDIAFEVSGPARRQPTRRDFSSFAAEHLAFRRYEPFDRLAVTVIALDFIERAFVRLSSAFLPFISTE